MTVKMSVLLASLVAVLYAGHGSCVLRAQQQVFLPPIFYLGARVTLQSDSNKVFTIVAQQGAWIRVLGPKSSAAEPDETETWIYAPNGTVWTKAK